MVSMTSLKDCIRLFKEGRAKDAFAGIGELTRRQTLDAIAMQKAGAFLRREVRQVVEFAKPLSVRILGQCSMQWVASATVAVAWGQGVMLDLSLGEFDNVLQDLLGPSTAGSSEVIVLMPWSTRQFTSNEAFTEDRMERELDFWKQAAELATQRHGARVVQIGFDWPRFGPLGVHLGSRPGGPIDALRVLNARLRAQLPPGAYWLDLDRVAGVMGRDRFYDMRRYFWTKQPFSEEGSALLARHLWAGIRALTSGPKKVLAIDLDQTIWGGVVGERGALGIGLGDDAEGEAFRDFQRYLKSLSYRGIILAAVSKNSAFDAREPFEKNPQMILKLEDFSAFEATWEPKARSLERIAKSLNLGLDSFVFFDDNPAEREHILQALPEISVVPVPEDPASYVGALEEGLWFEAVGLTGEDRDRVKQYKEEGRRRDFRSATTDLSAYLRSLEMVAEFDDIGPGNLVRVVQLIGKTNQFNLTSRRHGAEAVRALLSSPRSMGLTMSVHDRFGDYGLVGVALGECDKVDGDAMRLDTLLMSCRIIGRTAEDSFFCSMLKRASSLGYARLIGEFMPTTKNEMVAGLYTRWGFSEAGTGVDGMRLFKIEISDSMPPAHFLSCSGTFGP